MLVVAQRDEGALGQQLGQLGDFIQWYSSYLVPLAMAPGSIGTGDTFGAALLDLVGRPDGCLTGTEVYVGDSAADAACSVEVLAITAN